MPGVHWLKEAYFDLDLDAYFDEAQKLFSTLHPDKDMLQRPEESMPNNDVEYSDDEAKVIDNLMMEFTEKKEEETKEQPSAASEETED